MHNGFAAPVTVVGLGPMGYALAEAFLAAGHPTTVWNRSAHKADPLVAEGAVRAATAAEALAASDLAVVCVADYAAMHAALDHCGTALSGKVLVNLCSGTPQEAREALTWATAHGAGYLDGAIMVPVEVIGTPSSVVFYSGAREPFDAHRNTLDALGGVPRYLGGDAGLAVLHNTALLGLMWATVNGFLHAAALVESGGVGVADFAETAVDWFLPSVTGEILRAEAARIDREEFPGDGGTLAMCLTAIEHIVRTSRDAGISDEVPSQLKALGDRAVAAGYGDENYMSLIKVLRVPSAATHR
ncbi:3-hydroxyisobutyrate dehydrogenase-like beta-hydroxyacid dehydrogenase [Saccharopolyspora erythraea NRRL 2338]|uniref:6-phosphogluconate dehydrogenase, NAD-binding n=2 Tax=Saccharopolyspora erythraea TaxID=1836 RepID=A4FP11_SACEN|nr:NAD(P)-binding domain-containing protein [Saccharopolyspora erythraea]EQD81379.1 6-phosphogluconate dehydrogenase [Saccharopolyspora erythraea D]PFG99428.1 3-hydroxyisobutyrate dehydrogenase-like beta-hydroxyacid dehydrogenase [Saccharopolyspora erythraea NRRL 2338]QRK89338.1 NAD(P)-dependent oxidoreductase [Saccharopolyspora erythraea]CAM05786.1 6-phosphogluconate dehydrogenase, NAD-binding [Saccharopolyspora erythraea NRRL 2338]